ncbi:MAG: nucleoside triphosphate pyrophosphohydrolase [Rhodospirillaceae bacterium]|nr:nucleoside triphosphate pyrophosphohydrolase [Rhodospirillaceae bacterium]
MTAQIDRLLAIMARLRDPSGGCPWDIEQSFASIAPYTIEEAYEVAEAIETGDISALRDELGDLLLQVVFHSRIAEEQNLFAFNDVVKSVSDKMIRRHPHVFGEISVANSSEQLTAWENIKAAERAAAEENKTASALDGVALSLPAASRAAKLQARAARVGFDWPDTAPVLAKITEELTELKTEIDAGSDQDRIEDEMGDLLFACINLARKLKIDPESALRRCNRKFERRFHYIERKLAASGLTPKEAGLDAMDALWTEAKTAKLDQGGDGPCG